MPQRSLVTEIRETPEYELQITNNDLTAFGAKAINMPSAEAKAGRERVKFLRERLEKHIAANPGFSLVKMLHAGSVAKGTALRSTNDMDVAVYVRKDDAPETDLVLWMTERLRAVYGGTISPDAIQPGVHCATITFADGLSVDVVPVLYEGDPDDRGYLIARDTGDRLLTSVRLHLDFIRARKSSHPNDFAQIVRYVKWWIREQKKLDGEFRFKSFMAELVVAHLADGGLDVTDHAAALAATFDFIAGPGMGGRIWFSDYYEAGDLPVSSGLPVEIYDPVNPDNNVAYRYTEFDLKRITAAAGEACDAITEAGYATTKTQAVECWQIVLGSRFKG